MLYRLPRRRVAQNLFGTFPAPTRGLNLRDSKTAMKPQDALVLDNYFPEETYVRLRRGSEAWVTGFPGPVETIMEWAGAASRKLFAASVSGIYDATSQGAVGAASVTGLTNVSFVHTMFANSGANYLYCVNGADDPRHYNGSSWATPSITGVTGASLNYVAAHKKRLWFVEKETTSAWYLPVDAISGAASEFDLGAEFTKGGKLLMIGSLSSDAGDSVDDYLAFISSTGQIVVYQGTDPSSANTWAKVGLYEVGAPVSNRAALKVGGDLALISADGVVSVQQMLALDRSASAKASVSNRIDPALSSAYRLYGSNTGWQALTHVDGHFALVNVPISSSTFHQYVMNTQTGAWCRFKGWNAYSWGLFNGGLYFGAADSVVKADTGTDDRDAAIEGEMQPAYQSFGSNSMLKNFKLARPLFRSNALPTLAISINTDYRDESPTSADAVPLTSSAPTWGTMVWGSFIWQGVATQSEWFAVTGMGFTASPRLYTSTATATIEIDAIDVLYERAQGASI
jgi:hypothetical protein